MRWLLIPLALLLALSAPVRAGDGPPLPTKEQAERFFDLLRKTSPLPGDLRAVATSPAGPEEEEEDDLDLLFGAPEAVLVGGRTGGSLTLAGRRVSVVAPVPTAPEAAIRDDWRAAIAGLRAGRGVDAALDRIRGAASGPRVSYLVGLARFTAGRPVPAAEEFSRAAEGEGLRLPSLLLAGAAFIEAGRPENALSPLRRALSIAPDGVASRTLLGEALARCRRQKEAAGVLAPLAAKEEATPRIRLLHARALVLSGRAREALPLLAPLAREGGVRYGALMVLARAHRRLGDPAAAIRALDGALALRPKALLPASIKVQALSQAGRAGEGLALARALVPHYPGRSRAYRTATYAELAAGHAERALDVVRKWRERFPKSVAARLAGVRALHAAGRQKEALKELDAISKDHPKMAVVARLRKRISESE